MNATQKHESDIRVRFAGEDKFRSLRENPDEDAADTSTDDVRARLASTDSVQTRLQKTLLEALQMQHLAILAGCGASIGAGGPSMKELWDEAQPPDDVITTVKLPEREKQDIEALLSRCDGWLSLHDEDSDAKAVKAFRQRAVDVILRRCREAGKNGVDAHVTLLRKLARRRVRDSRLRVFTTNYDRCFERAASQLGLVVIDGFSFTEPRRFDASYFDMDMVHRVPGQEAPTFVPGVFQLFKLHGSVDWRIGDGGSMHPGSVDWRIDDGGSMHPVVNVDPAVDGANACLIYPARTKYQLSFRQPHLELMARFWSTLRGPNTCLLVVGFGFNDDHLSAPILSALHANPSLRAIVVDPCAEDRLNPATKHDAWRRLGQLALDGVDITFVSATFEEFVSLVPDLKALTPAQRLERDLRSLLRSGHEGG